MTADEEARERMRVALKAAALGHLDNVERLLGRAVKELTSAMSSADALGVLQVEGCDENRARATPTAEAYLTMSEMQPLFDRLSVLRRTAERKLEERR